MSGEFCLRLSEFGAHGAALEGSPARSFSQPTADIGPDPLLSLALRAGLTAVAYHPQTLRSPALSSTMSVSRRTRARPARTPWCVVVPSPPVPDAGEGLRASPARELALRPLADPSSCFSVACPSYICHFNRTPSVSSLTCSTQKQRKRRMSELTPQACCRPSSSRRLLVGLHHPSDRGPGPRGRRHDLHHRPRKRDCASLLLSSSHNLEFVPFGQPADSCRTTAPPRSATRSASLPLVSRARRSRSSLRTWAPPGTTSSRTRRCAGSAPRR